MQTPGETETAEAARARRQAQIALSDLSTTATRESDAYMAQTDSRGRAIPSNPFRDAQVAARVQQRQAQLQASGHSATAAWNSPSAIPGTNPDDLRDSFGGQGHRLKFTPTMGSVRAGPTTIPRIRNGPRSVANPANGPAAFQATSAVRQRADSPTTHGTIRDVGGHREELPLPHRHCHPGNGGNSPGPAPGAPRMAYRQPVIQAHEVRFEPPLHVTVAHRQPTPTPHIPQAPRLTPTHPASQVSEAPGLTPLVPEPSDWPPPLRIRKVSQQPRVTREPSAAERDQQKIKEIFDAIGTDRLLVLMTGKYHDGPEITRAKVLIRDNAIRTTEPNNAVKAKGEQWVAIFHAVRKDLVSHAIEMACVDAEEGDEQVMVTAENYFEFGLLFNDVLEAFCVVRKSIESEPAVQDKWASDGNKDILDRAIEKYAALTAAERELETSIQQTFERLDPLDLALQSYGVSTIITGPVTPAALNLNQDSDFYGSPPSYIAALGEVQEAAEDAPYMSDDTDSYESL